MERFERTFNQFRQRMGSMFATQEDEGEIDAIVKKPEDITPKSYKMDNPSRGTFVLINPCGDEREGSDVDVKRTMELADLLGFKEIVTLTNSNVNDLRNEIRKLKDKDYSKQDCFVCVVMSHGGKDDEISAKQGTFNLSWLVDQFDGANCTSLTGKPKLFFIQACRGGSATEAVDIPEDRGYIDALQSDPSVPSIPADVDVFIGHATLPGHVANRDNKGSIYIEALLQSFRSYHQKLGFLEIMTLVNRKVALGYESSKFGGGDCQREKLYSFKKQMPSFVSRLTGDIKFV